MVRTGDAYTRGLRDGRAVFLDGDRVADVTIHPAFEGVIRTVAALYDLACDSSRRELMTYPSPRDGIPINKAWLVPRTREDLVSRRSAIQYWADASFGFLGRSPDHVASFFAGFAGSAEFFARGGRQFADNLLRFAAKAADEDLYVSYVIVHPTIDRTKPAHQQTEPYLYAGVAAERDDGFVLRGAQMLGTGAVMSDYIFVSVILPLRAGDEDYAISCVVPNRAEGVKLYPRRPYAIGATSVFDYPLSSRFDETDSLVVFDDVFVPWEDVFVYKNLDLTAGQFSVTAAHVLGNTQSHIRSLAKLRFLIGLIKRCMDLSGRTGSADTSSQLGDLASRVSLVEGMILGAEAAAEPDRFGVMRPKDSLLYASQVLQQAMYPVLLQQMRGLMGGSLIQLPATIKEFQSPAAADIGRYVRWPHASGRQRVKLLKLLWDALGSEFGSRHLQYEMFYAGEPAAIQGREFRTFDWAAVDHLVERCLAGYDGEEE